MKIDGTVFGAITIDGKTYNGFVRTSRRLPAALLKSIGTACMREWDAYS